MEKRLFFRRTWNYKENRLNQDIKGENFEKNLINSIEANHQISMTFDHSGSSKNSFKIHLNAKSFNMLLTL